MDVEPGSGGQKWKMNGEEIDYRYVGSQLCAAQPRSA
jgi:hypothetical protein